MQQEINELTIQDMVFKTLCMPRVLMKYVVKQLPCHFEHYANPMVHPITGETISSYEKLMNNPATAEIMKTALGKDFSGMAQGGNKTGQKGTNAKFVMRHDKNFHALIANKMFTYSNPVVDHCPQETDPHKI